MRRAQRKELENMGFVSTLVPTVVCPGQGASSCCILASEGETSSLGGKFKDTPSFPSTDKQAAHETVKTAGF